MIRVTKAFLPLLKCQAYERSHCLARIVNVGSVAGLIASGATSSYNGSKFAAEAFSASLRQEMRSLDVSVVTVNPSFHRTPLTSALGDNLRRVWDGIAPDLRGEYGEGFFRKLKKKTEQNIMCDPETVVDEILSCVELKRPPPQVIIGSDAKYTIMALLLFPVWLREWIVFTATGASELIPARMEKSVEIEN